MKKKWSNQDILDDAKRFRSRSEWQKKSGSKYQIARKRGLLTECCEHMMSDRKAKGTWDAASILKSAKAFNSKTEWRKAFPGAYQKARTLGIINECSDHMTGGKRYGYWTRERCINESQKYNYIHEFRHNSPGAYAAAIREGWWVDIQSKFKAHIRKRKWNKQACKNDALLYDRRSDWAKASDGAYRSALRKGWLDECCEHMDTSYVDLPRYIYAIYDNDEFYVGLSYDPERRYRQHSRTIESSAYNLVQGLHCFEVVGGPYEESISGEKEEEFFHKFLRTGRESLNRAKAGSLGAREVSWTQEACMEDALRYQTRSEWRAAEGSGYDTASRKGWLEICCTHMVSNYVSWSDDELITEARKYKTKGAWRKKSPNGYDTAARRSKSLFAKATSHMPKNARIKWTAEGCLAEARKYESRKEWRDHQASSVAAAKRLGVYEQCVAHMGERKNGR